MRDKVFPENGGMLMFARDCYKDQVGLMGWCNKYNQRKAFNKKINDENLPVAWHPK